jgi:hypothetical protein
MGAAAPALRLARSDTFHMPTPGARAAATQPGSAEASWLRRCGSLETFTESHVLVVRDPPCIRVAGA